MHTIYDHGDKMAPALHEAFDQRVGHEPAGVRSRSVFAPIDLTVYRLGRDHRAQQALSVKDLLNAIVMVAANLSDLRQAKGHVVPRGTHERLARGAGITEQAPRLHARLDTDGLRQRVIGHHAKLLGLRQALHVQHRAEHDTIEPNHGAYPTIGEVLQDLAEIVTATKQDMDDKTY